MIQIEQNSDCTCTNDDDTPSDNCYDCWEDTMDNLYTEILNVWAEKHNVQDSDFIHIDGKGVGWMSSTIETDILFKYLTSVFIIRGDFRLKWTLLDDGHLSVARYSHDEPTGCTFNITPVEVIA